LLEWVKLFSSDDLIVNAHQSLPSATLDSMGALTIRALSVQYLPSLLIIRMEHALIRFQSVFTPDVTWGIRNALMVHASPILSIVFPHSVALSHLPTGARPSTNAFNLLISALDSPIALITSTNVQTDSVLIH